MSVTKKSAILLVLAAVASAPGSLLGQESTLATATTPKSIEIMIDGRVISIPLDGSARFPLDGADYTIQIHAATGHAATGQPTREDGQPSATAGLPPFPREVPEAAPWIDWTSPSVWLTVVLGLALTAVATYFLLIQPFRRRRLLKEALKIIGSGVAGKLPRAETLLSQALLAGLRKKEIAMARFALAFVRAQLGNFEAAATVLADLEASQRVPDRETVYLSMWVHSKLDKHEKVERLYQKHSQLLAGMLDSKLIASIAYLKLARLFWTRKDVDGALHYFEQVRKLAVLVDQIPEHLESHAVVLGIVSLFEKQIDEARERFQGAVEAANQAGKSPLHGELGLLLCQWRTEEIPTIDAALGEIVAGLTADGEETLRFAAAECPHCGRPYRTHRRVSGGQLRCTGCRHRFPSVIATDSDEAELLGIAERDATANLLLTEEDLLLRNVRLWYAISLLFVWRQKPERSGLTDEDLDELLRRLAQVSLVDPELGDPHLVAGLMLYYCGDEQRREEGRRRLEQAVESDVHVPEVLQLLECENKLAALRRNSLSYFHQLAAEYVANPEVKAEYRQEFKRRMERFRRFLELGEVEMREVAGQVAPSLQDLQHRTQILRNRVANIVHHKLSDAEQEARESLSMLLGDVSEKTQLLATHTQDLEKSEHSLLATAGQFLFDDEKIAD